MKHKLLLLLLVCATAYADKVGLLIVATGKYIEFIPPLIESGQKYFMPEDEVTYYIFTDGQLDLPYNNVVVIPHKRYGWPLDSILRCKVHLDNRHLMEQEDYLYATDADMRFCNVVGAEIKSERVGTQSPGFIGRRGTYETDTRSAACVRSHEGNIYYAGALYGGTKEEFFKIDQAIYDLFQIDYAWGFIARHHDESYLNRYFVSNPPTLTLSVSYCYPESWKLPYIKRLLALDKVHALFQTKL